jgi:hypothetical protein
MGEIERRVMAPPPVRAVPVPHILAELGVRVGRDEEAGMAVVVIPPDVRQAVNVINPTTSFAQADPNWTPSISLVQLDKDLHGYPLPGSKVGLNKQALETLARAAGVLYTRTTRVPRDELHEGELFAYRATVGFRRSDGTIDEVTRERGFVEAAERAEIEDAVTRNDRYGARESEAWQTEVRKRWLNELRFGPAKVESKAINRALRAGLQVPTSLAPAAFGKPFLVIGYSFTPDYDDAEVKRILVAAGLNAQAAIYGGRQVAGELEHATDIEPPVRAELAAGTDETGGEPTPSASAGAPGSPPSSDPGAGAHPAGETAGADAASDAAPADEPGPEEEMPPADDADEPPAFAIPAAAVDESEQVEVTFGRWQGQTLGAIAAHEKGATWYAWALAQPVEKLPQPDLLTHVRIVAQARLPEVYAEHEPAAGE